MGTLLLSSTLLAEPGQQRQVIEKRDDLPRHTYRIAVKAIQLFEQEKALLKLARQVKKDLQADLDSYVINDKTTLQEYYTNLGTIAILEKEWDTYLGFLEKRRQLEDKEASRLTMGLAGEVIVSGMKTGAPDLRLYVEDYLRKRVSAMPYEVVEPRLKARKGSAEIISSGLVLGRIESGIQPMLEQSDGEMSLQIAGELLNAAFTLKYYIPVKDVIARVLSELISANRVQKEDIWTARQVKLKDREVREPVIMAIWDSGVDTAVFARTQQLWRNSDEIPKNGLDDDNNGFIDDVHGIAYSLHSDKETSLLLPIGSLPSDTETLKRQMKGLTDIQSAIDSEEASQLKQKLSTLKPEEVKPLIESVNLYSHYAHGTHVAGIAANGNPYARILAARITFDHRLIPEEPTVEQALKDAKAITEVISYFRENGVRAVNMSWGGSVSEIESALEKNNAGGTPEERKALARKIFSIVDEALRSAIQQARGILFITSTGNRDNDVRFDEFIPSSYDYPNILSVGAVDQAGDQTSFTSFGKVDVYANGFEVLSYVPGGDQLKLNGTSMSAPQVINLVGKLLALNPGLTVPQLRSLILEGSEARQAGNRCIKLIDPRRTMQLLREWGWESSTSS
jgi:hypothetical protein